MQGGIGAPQRETQLFGIAFTGDGTTSVDSLTLTLLGFPDDLDVAGNFVEFRLFESADATLDTSGVPDELVGSIGSSDVTLGIPFTIELEVAEHSRFWGRAALSGLRAGGNDGDGA